MTVQVDSGLAGVVVADTELSMVDGQAGKLVFRGRSIAELAGRARVEDVAALLWNADPDEVSERLARGRVAAHEHFEGLRLDHRDGMDALRAALASLPEDADPVAAAPVAVARWARGESIAPDADLDHATDFTRMILGSTDPVLARAVGTYLVAVADHGFNASTFVARVVTSTGSDPVSAVVAAVGALKGPLHGGAPGPVLDMLDAIGTPDRAEPWIRAELAAGRRIMGMGHRVYRVRDPRAAVLEQAVEGLTAAGVASEKLALARATEQAAERILAEKYPNRPLRANVEFYTAVLLDAVGWDRTWFAPTFAVGRSVGWWAHILEQRRTGRLIRPSARYVGPSA